MTEIWLTVEGCSFFPLQTCIFSASQLFLPQTRVFSASWLVFSLQFFMFPTIAAISSNFRGALRKIAIDAQTYRHSAKRLQAISVFFGKLKESKAPETTSETEGLGKLEGT